jgi:predicted permease
MKTVKKFFSSLLHSELGTRNSELHIRLIRIIGIIIPRRLRTNWKQEWEAELRYRERTLARWDQLNWRGKFDLLRRSVSAFWDALVLQPRRLEDEMFQDLRFGARMLVKQPGFTVIVVLTLALGIGANTAIFSVLDAVLLRPLPVKDPQQLVFLSNPNRHGINSQETGDRRLFAYHEFEWLRDHNQSFSDIFAAQSTLPNLPITVEGAGDTIDGERAGISLVSGAYFSTLGVKTALGQIFTATVDRVTETDPGAVLSYNYWKNRFALDPAILGRKLRVRNVTLQIIGVAGPEFTGETVGFAPDVWVPLTSQTAEISVSKAVLAPPKDVQNKFLWLQVMARLKPGVGFEQAQAGVNVTLQQMLQSEATQLAADQRQAYLNQRIALTDGQRGASTLRTRFGEPLLILMGLVGLVLLIACANIANLLLARASAREKEFAVRIALGAGRRRLLQQLLTETALLTVLGGGIGLLLAQWAELVLLRLVSSGATLIPLDLQLDLRVLGFTFGLSVLTGLLFGLLPALRATRVNVHTALKGASQNSALANLGGRIPIGKLLAAGQVALSIVLLIVAGLLVRSFQKLTRVELGYDSTHILQFNSSPNRDNYPGPADQLHRELLDRLRTIPGARNASLSLSGLFNGVSLSMGISIESHTPVPGQTMRANSDYVGPDYFTTAGIPILAGREIGTQDAGNVPLVGVISQTMARTFFGAMNPIGRRIRASESYGTFDFVIVGVAADAKHDDLRETAESWFYLPYFHPARHPNFAWAIHEVRFAGNPAPIAAAIREAIKNTAPLMEMPELQTISELAGQSVLTERMITQLSGLFALLALLLACIGLYGVMTYNIARRTQEIGIRMALGAQPNQVLRMALSESLVLILIGTTFGVAVALGSARLISSFLYGLTPTDPPTILFAVISMITVSLLATWLPARRASRIDPLVALRNN